MMCVLCQIADFGLARSQQYLTSATATVKSVGTPAWSSPEYLKKQKFTAKDDVYSLGVVSRQWVTSIVFHHSLQHSSALTD